MSQLTSRCPSLSRAVDEDKEMEHVTNRIGILNTPATEVAASFTKPASAG